MKINWATVALALVLVIPLTAIVFTLILTGYVEEAMGVLGVAAFLIGIGGYLLWIGWLSS